MLCTIFLILSVAYELLPARCIHVPVVLRLSSFTVNFQFMKFDAFMV
jgi:hypothetical protein